MSHPVRYAIREAIYVDQLLVVKIGGALSQTRNPCSLSRDPRPPWVAKLVIGLFIAYAPSPIDLIPDFIPALGYLGDLLL